MNLDEIMNQYQKDREDSNSLSDLAIKLAAALFTFGNEVATAELEEKSESVRLQNEPIIEGDGKIKRMSSTQADTTAVVNSLNIYGEKKLAREAGYKLLDAINSRLMVLLSERKHTVQQEAK